MNLSASSYDPWERIDNIVFEEVLVIAKLQRRFELHLAPDYSEIFRWLHAPQPTDTALENAARTILNDPPMQMHLLPPWALEFYHNKDAIFSLFERYASTGGYDRFVHRGVVREFVEHFRNNTVHEFASRQPDYWRELTDYLRWFSEEERDSLWTVPVARFIRDIQTKTAMLEVDRHFAMPGKRILQIYTSVRQRLNDRRNDDRKMHANNIDAISAACVHHLNARFAATEQRYYIAMTASQGPLQVFRDTPCLIGDEPLPMAVSPVSIECHQRLKVVWKRGADKHFQHFEEFIEHGLSLLKKTRNVQPPATVHGYISELQFKQIQLIQNYGMPGFNWLLGHTVDSIRDVGTDVEDKAEQVYEFVADKNLFDRQMTGVLQFLRDRREVLDSHSPAVRRAFEKLQGQYR